LSPLGGSKPAREPGVLWGNPSPPITWFSRVVGKSNDYDNLAFFDGYERERESVKNKLSGPGSCSFVWNWNQWGIWLFEQLNGFFKSINQSHSKPNFLLLVPGSSFPAGSYFQKYQPPI